MSKRRNCEAQNKLRKEGKFGGVLNPSLQAPDSINHSHFNLIQAQPFQQKNKNTKEEENTQSLKPSVKRKFSSSRLGEGWLGKIEENIIRKGPKVDNCVCDCLGEA